MKFGSVCSGIEAASLAFESVDIEPSWFSEIEDFPSSVLSHHYPKIKNYGDMNNLPELILNEEVEAPDILCGGTPCQAFSLAGWRAGLADERGQLTLRFIDIANSIDTIRIKNGQNKSIIMWENVEGVLRDKTNAFGNFIAGLAGLDESIDDVGKWTSSGVLYGKERNVAWRVLDSKYFGTPQQRKRLYVIATDININPELILFEKCNDDEFLKLKNLKTIYKNKPILQKSCLDIVEEKDNHNNIKIIDGEKVEVFRDYTDCLYSAYGTKWNGNAAAYNGSLFISQNDKVRRLTPLECERLMGFPDNYTNLPKAKDTSRYKAIGNSWAIQTVEWLANRIVGIQSLGKEKSWISKVSPVKTKNTFKLYLFKSDFLSLSNNFHINISHSSNTIKKGNIFDIVDTNPTDKLYISSKASSGIIRRKKERSLNMNQKLESLFLQNINEGVLNQEALSLQIR